MANKRKLNAQEAKLLFESLRAIDLLPWRLGEEEARARITGIVGKEKLVECPIPQKLMLHDNTVAPPPFNCRQAFASKKHWSHT